MTTPQTSGGGAHTPGLVNFTGLSKASNFAKHVATIQGDNCSLARVRGGITDDKKIAIANGQRFAAAWNAAHDAGLTTAALEAGAVKDALAALKDAAIFLEVAAGYLPDQETKIDFPSTREKFKSRGLRSVVKEVAAQARAAITKAGQP